MGESCFLGREEDLGAPLILLPSIPFRVPGALDEGIEKEGRGSTMPPRESPFRKKAVVVCPEGGPPVRPAHKSGRGSTPASGADGIDEATGSRRTNAGILRGFWGGGPESSLLPGLRKIGRGEFCLGDLSEGSFRRHIEMGGGRLRPCPKNPGRNIWSGRKGPRRVGRSGRVYCRGHFNRPCSPVGSRKA